MKNDEWYKNESWSEEIAALFEEKLKRSRGAYSKTQYLAIQAGILLKSKELKDQEAGISLAKRIFSDFSNDDLDVIPNLIRVTEYLGSYYMKRKDYLMASKEYQKIANGSLKKTAYNGNSESPLKYIDAVIKGKLTDQYLEALKVLEEFDIKSLDLKSEFFLAGKVGAFLHNELGNLKEAKEFAVVALKFLKDVEPTFKKYPNLGVPEASAAEINLLLELAK